MTPLISVIVPAYNCERYLAEAVGSALAQTLSDIEVLIIDDCSADETPRVARTLAAGDARVRVFTNAKNIGVAAARNRGFDEARGPYIALLDADDRWVPSKLERQLAHMEKTRCDICYTAYSFINETGGAIRAVYHVPETTNIRLHIKENVIGCSTALLRRCIIENVRMRGEYAHEDYVFWLEAMRRGYSAAGFDEPLTAYRMLDTARSRDKRKAAKGRWRVYRDFAGMGFCHSCLAFACYALRGVQKHYMNG